MPADRLLHPKAGHSQKVTSLTDLEYRVWTQYLLSADDFGVMRASPATLQEGNDYLENRPAKMLQRCLETLVRVGLVRAFDHQGRRYLFQPDWQAWQKIEYPRATDNPKPPDADRASCDEATQKLIAKHPGGWRKPRHGQTGDDPKDLGHLRDTAGTREGEIPLKPLAVSRKPLAVVQEPVAVDRGDAPLRDRPNPRQRPPTLVTPPVAYAHVAHFSPLGDVPQFVHQEFVRKTTNSGLTEDAADRRVRGFYATVETQFAGQVIGDDPVKFWRARWADAHGTTVARPGASTREAVPSIAESDARRAKLLGRA